MIPKDYWMVCPAKPGVLCNRRCARCGWNPEEQARRLKEGYFKSGLETRFGRFCEVRSLCFPISQEVKR